MARRDVQRNLPLQLNTDVDMASFAHPMKIKALLLSLLACLTGCSKSEKTGLEDVVAHFERNGIKGTVQPMPPVNADIMATVTITLDTGGQGTKMVSVARCKDEATATRSYEDALKNSVFAGTTRNGLFVLFCTFFPADPTKATEVQEVFRSYKP
jgi:hypothetical protein